MSIQVEGKFTFGDVWHGSVRVCRKTLVILSVLGVLTIGMGIWLGREKNESWLGEPLFLWLGVFWLVYLWPFLAYRSYATLKKSPNLRGVVRYQFDEKGYRLETIHASAEIKWAALVKWIESRDCFLLYQNPKIGTIVPKRFFQNAADVDAVRGFLQASVPRK